MARAIWCWVLVLFSFLPHIICFSSSRISFRNAKFDDLMPIADLLADVFEGPFDWYQGLNRQKASTSFNKLLTERYNALVAKGSKHAMIVACDDVQVIGFCEIGELPSVKRLAASHTDADSSSSHSDELYLGNLAVAESHRRQRVGYRLVKVSMKVAEKWGEKSMNAIVDASNKEALSFYNNLGFEVVFDERDSIYLSKQKGPRLFLSKLLDSQKSTTTTTKTTTDDTQH